MRSGGTGDEGVRRRHCWQVLAYWHSKEEGIDLRLLDIFSCLALCAASVPAPALADGVQYDRTAISGELLVLGNAFEIDSTCRLSRKVKIRELKAPENGTFASRSAKVFPNYPSSNKALYHCNSQRVSGAEQTYKSHPGYTGPDAVDFEIVYASGKTQRIHINITVVPGVEPAHVELDQTPIDLLAANSGELSDGALARTPILGVTPEYQVPDWVNGPR